MQLTEDQIRRIARREATFVYSRGGGVSFGGGVPASWVDENYIAIKFFNEIFVVKGKKTTTVGSGTPVVNNNYIFEPNEVPGTKTTTEGGVTTTIVTEITNIQVKAGLWTQKFLSALGQGSGGSGGSGSLANLSDVLLTNPQAGQILVYRNTHWLNEDMPSPGGSGTVTSVGLSVPTGLLVSNGSSQTITSAGTFALTLASGYEMFKPLDYFDASKNAKKANALNVAAAKKVWGQTYLNASGVPQDVTGNMTNVGDISFDTNGTRNIGSISNSALAIYARYGYFFSTAPAVHVGNDNTHFIALHWSNFVDNVNTRGLYDYEGGWVCGFNGTNTYLMGGNVGVGLRTPTVKLHVDGGVLATKVYLYKPNAANDTGAVYLEYDSTKLGIHLVGAGIYTDTYVSALGVGSGGSGSATALADLADVSLNNPSAGQILVYRNSHWVNENMPSPGGSGTVTSISAGTGLSSSTGGSITTTGTISISSTYQTYISDGETAYGWGNHAAAGYLTGITDSMINTALGFTLSGTAGDTYNLDAFLTGITDSMINTALGFTLTGTVGETYDLDDIGTLKGYFTNGVANEAACLTTTNKQAWGQTFWTTGGIPQDVSGNLDYVGNITMDQLTYPTIYLGEDLYCYIKKTSVSGSTYGEAIAIRVGGSGEQFNFRDDMFYSALEIRTSVGVYSAGYVTTASDINLKDKIGTPTLTTEDIASASPILFKWKDRKDQDVHVGAIAQEWQKLLPEVVRENDGVLSMDYGVAALISSMIIAKTVVNHEQRLTLLENELNKQKEL